AEVATLRNLCLREVGRTPAPVLLATIFRLLPPKLVSELVSRLNLLQALEFEELLDSPVSNLAEATVALVKSGIASKWVNQNNRRLATQLFWSFRYKNLIELLSLDAPVTDTEDALHSLFHLTFMPLFVARWDEVDLALFQPGAILADPKPVIAQWGDDRPALDGERIVNFAKVVVRGIQTIRLLPQMLDSPGLGNAARHFEFSHVELHLFHLARSPLVAISELVAARRRYASEVSGARELRISSLGLMFCKMDAGLGGLLRELDFGARYPPPFRAKRRRGCLDGDPAKLELHLVSTQLSVAAYFELVDYIQDLPLTVLSISSFRIKGDDISRLLDSLVGKDTLQTLNLDHQKLNLASAESLGRLLGAETCRVARLALTNVEFEVGAVLRVSEGLGLNSTLRHIDLSHADLSAAQSEELSQLFLSLGQSAAATIILDNCEIPIGMISSCIHSLSAAQALSTLGLRGQYLGESIPSLAQLFRARHLYELEIDFQGARFVDFSSTFFQALSEGLGIERLHLTSSRLNDAALVPLVSLLKANVRFPVWYLDLSFNHITELGAGQLAAALALGHYPGLAINLSNNYIPQSFFGAHPQLLCDTPVSHRLFSAPRSPEGFDDYYS
ncbi:hypothetical protein L0F63_004031, partial [Massospora cicadina]